VDEATSPRLLKVCELDSSPRPVRISVGVTPEVCGITMTDSVPAVVEIVPLRSAGIDSVRSVRFDDQALTVDADAQTFVFHYADIAEWPFPAALRRLMWRIGWRKGAAAVGERWWHTDPQFARIEFFTTPRLTIWMPADGHLPYGNSPWVQIQRRLGASDFFTWDMT